MLAATTTDMRRPPAGSAIPIEGLTTEEVRPFPMDTQQVSAPSRATSRVPGRVTAFGVVHVNAIHTSRFTIVGNHLAQHGQLSLTAIGLAVHIQSLPDGAKVGIEVLADRFPESEARIAAALRDLQNCDKCDRAFRGPVPGRCRDCRDAQAAA